MRERFERLVGLVRGREDLSDWSALGTERRRDELYLIGAGTEARRTVAGTRHTVGLYVRAERGGSPMTGASHRELAADLSLRDLRREVDECAFAASLALNQAYALDEPRPARLSYPAADPGITADPAAAMLGLRAAVLDAVAREPGVRLASAEIFLHRLASRRVTSRGLDDRSDGTRVVLEVQLLAGEGASEIECGIWREERFVDVLDVPGLLARWSEHARRKVRATLPPSGPRDVVFEEDALEGLFEYFRHQTYAASLYHHTSTCKVGDELVGKPRGDRLTLSYDPTLPGGLCTGAYDAYGTLLEPVTFVRDNKVACIPADKRHADYLGLPATGFTTNVVVAPGTRPAADLLAEGTLVVTQFSTFAPDTTTGAFSGEIRVGGLVRGGVVQPVKGGSVTGHVQEAFREATLSLETVQRGGYLGPRAVRLAGLTVTGA